MVDLVTDEELAGIQQDLQMLLGRDEHNLTDESAAKTVITIYRPGTKSIDTDTLESSQTPAIVYNGPAMIGPMVFRRDRQELAGEEATRIRIYRCLLPHDAGDIHLDDYVVVDKCDDSFLLSRRLEVSDVMYESVVGARRITLTDVTRDTVTE